MPGDDDLRAAERRGDRGRDHGPGRRRRASTSSTPPTRTRSAATWPPGAHRGDHRPLAARQAGPFHHRDQVLRADRARAVRRRQLAQAHHVGGRGLAAPPADRLHRPVPAARLRPEHADRRDARRPRRPGAPGQGPLHRLLQLPDLPAGPGDRPQRDPAAGQVRLGAAAVQPAVPPDRAGDAAVLRGRGHRRHPLQPDRGRAAVRQARPSRPAAGGQPVHPRLARAMYQERYWNEREFDTVEALRKLAEQAGVSLVTLAVAWVLANRRSPRRSSGPAGPSSWPQPGRRRVRARRRPEAAARRAHARVPDGDAPR